MALGKEYAPYIHTSFLNFKREEFGTTSKDISKSSKIEKKIAELESIKKDLKQAAETFLKGKTPSEIFEEAFNGYEDFIKISRSILTNKQFYYSLNSRLKVKLNTKNLPKQMKAILSKHYNSEIEEIFSEEITEILLSKISTKSGTIDKRTNLSKYFRDIFGEQIPKELIAVLSMRLRSTKSNGKLFKTLRKVIEQTYSENYSKSVGPVVRETFLEYFNKEYAKLNIATTPEKDKLKEKYLEVVCDNIIRELQSKSGRDMSNLLGYGGEELFAATHNIQGNNLTIEVVGSFSEDDLIQKEFSSTVYSLRDTSKQSYTDLIIEYQGRRVRVQSKNYQTVLNKYLEQAAMDNTKDILQQMHLLQGESVLEFFNRIRSTNLNIDLKEAAYVLANEAWFTSAGNIPNKQTGKVEKMDLYQSYIDAALSGALINYLGIMLEGDGVSIDRSNIFFLIDNKALVPTYTIVEHLITNLKEWNSEIEGIFLRIDKNLKYGAADATELLNRKKSVVGSFNGSSYQDSALLSVGMQKGAEVMNNLIIKSINLNISLQNLMTSSWIF